MLYIKRKLFVDNNMWHLKKFANNAVYKEYMSSDEIWLPRVAYILNGHTENIDSSGWDTNRNAQDWSDTSDNVNGLPLGGDNKRWVDYIQMGTHFIEMANNGILYFKDIQDPSLAGDLENNDGWYRASFVDGVLNITTPQGKATVDSSTLTFLNFPNDYSVYGGQI